MSGKSWLVAVVAIVALVSSLLYYEVLDARNSVLKKEVEDIRR